MQFSKLAAAASLLVATAIAGCGPDNGLHLAKVRGKVTYKGEPITYGTIMFEPEQGPPAIGSINSDGTFVLSTENSGDGAVVGPHRIAVIGLKESTQSAPALPDPETNPREFMIAKTKAGMAPRGKAAAAAGETITDKNGKVFQVTVPSKLTNASTSDLKTVIASGSNVVEIAIAEDGSATITP